MKSSSLLYPEKYPEEIPPNEHTAIRDQLLYEQPSYLWIVVWETAATFTSPEHSGQYFFANTSTFHSWGIPEAVTHIVTYYGSSDEWLSKQAAQGSWAPPTLCCNCWGGKSYAPYMFLKTCSLASLPPALVVGGSLWELIQPSNPATNYLRKSDWAFCQDREKNGSIKKFYKLHRQPKTTQLRERAGERKRISPPQQM